MDFVVSSVVGFVVLRVCVFFQRTRFWFSARAFPHVRVEPVMTRDWLVQSRQFSVCTLLVFVTHLNIPVGLICIGNEFRGKSVRFSFKWI